MLDELRNICNKICLLQAVKDIPIYAKKIKELCIKKIIINRKGIQNFQLMGKIAKILMGKTTNSKYLDLGRPILKIHISNIAVPNTLIDLGATINVMKKNTMDEVQLTNLQYTLIVLQLAHISIIKPEGILGDVLVSLDS